MPMTAPNDWNQNGMGEAAQQLVAAVMMDDRLGDDGAEPRSCGPPATAAPGRHAAADRRFLLYGPCGVSEISSATEADLPWVANGSGRDRFTSKDTGEHEAS